MKKYSNEELWNYLHQLMNDSDRVELESQLRSDPGLSQRMDDLKSLDNDVRDHIKTQAPVGFADNVMASFSSELNLSNVPLKTKVNTTLIRSIFIFFGITLGVCLIYLFSQLSFDILHDPHRNISIHTQRRDDPWPFLFHYFDLMLFQE